MSRFVAVANDFLALSKTCINYSSIINTCRLVSASDGKLSVEFEVDEHMTNHFGTLHGGCSATMIDIITTGACLLSKVGKPGVSVDLHTTYLNAAKVGETLRIDAEVIKAGRTLAFTKAEIIRTADNVKICTGVHTKAFPSLSSANT